MILCFSFSSSSSLSSQKNKVRDWKYFLRRRLRKYGNRIWNFFLHYILYIFLMFLQKARATVRKKMKTKKVLGFEKLKRKERESMITWGCAERGLDMTRMKKVDDEDPIMIQTWGEDMITRLIASLIRSD